MSAAATPHTSILPAGDAAPAPPGMPTAAPAPATFDILPDLHKLLSRLISTSPQHPAPTPAPTPGQPVGDGPLEMQHLATAATDVKLKIQKARRAVMALPDIGRTLEDQQEEIEDLQARIARLKASLRELGQPPGESEDGDQSHVSDCMQDLWMELGNDTT